MNDLIKDKLAILPKKPGCYLMKDASGTIIYVGKAINLANRVSSYFHGAHDYKTTKLVSHIADFEYIITKSEKEALILEYNLIKEYNPEYNIVFKDDKSYPYILLSDNDEPYCHVVRLKKNGKVKGKLFGPYTDVLAARNTVALINKLFPTRKCEHLQKSPCLYYHIHQCPGYCIDQAAYRDAEIVKNQILRFLNGDNRQIINDLKTKMQAAIDDLTFERAAEYRDLIGDIEHVALKQDVQISRKESFDVFSYAVKDSRIAIVGLFIRGGRLLNSYHYTDYLAGDPDDVASAFIYHFYQANPHPKKLYVRLELKTYLYEAVPFEVATVARGHKLALIKQAEVNAEQYLKESASFLKKRADYYDDIAEELQRIFHKPIHRIELFDNSHTGGRNTVAAMVVYEDFKPDKKSYRLYRLNDSADDLKSMYEVMYRRYFRVLKDDLKRPDLIIVDGAEKQINVAKQVLHELHMDITIAGLGKDDHHNTAYLLDGDCAKISLRRDSNIFFFLANMQDEVHRFAITYHKKVRQKQMTHSLLDDIKGLGPKRKTLLRRKFGSLTAMKQASLEELKVLLPDQVAAELYAYLRGKGKHAGESE